MATINTSTQQSLIQSTQISTSQNLNSPPAQQESLMTKITKYGKIGIVTHLTISWFILGLAYIVISRTNQTQKIIKFFKLQDKIPKKAGSFAIAFLVYKASIPVRTGISLMTIPFVIKVLDSKTQQDKTKQEDSINQFKNQINNILSEAGIAKQDYKVQLEQRK